MSISDRSASGALRFNSGNGFGAYERMALKTPGTITATAK
jgi:hypothetical protein